MKKILSNVMAVAMLAGLTCGVAGCGTTKVVEEIDENKVQLYIASYSGGAGYKWLDDPDDDLADDTESRFEAKYANTKFGDKTGVQVIVETSKGFSASKVNEGLTSEAYDLYFAPANYYDHVSQKQLLDITDMVTAVSAIDNKSIESKIEPDKQEKLKVDGKYYAVPYFTISQGITYDAGLFNENKLYFSKEMDTDGMRKFVTTKDATDLSCGPDAVYGTYDDGLPSSIKEFGKLMDRMRSGKGGEVILPFAFNGKGAFYTNYFIKNVSANMMGIDAVKAHATFDTAGKQVDIVTGFNGNTPIIEKKVITRENAYLLKSSAGMYYAIELAEKIFSDSNNYDTEAASEGSSSNLYAMERFLKSGKDGSTPIGMFIEGSYWYNEAESDGVLERVRKLGELKDIRVMALPHQYSGTVTPKAEGEAPVSQVIEDEIGFAFVASTIPQERMEAAKLFLQFCYSDEELVKAELANDGVMRSVIYDSSSIQDQISGYARSNNVMRAQAMKNGTICTLLSQDPISLMKTGYFTRENRGGYWNISWKGTNYDNPYTIYKETEATPKDYFNALQISEKAWGDAWYQAK